MLESLHQANTKDVEMNLQKSRNNLRSVITELVSKVNDVDQNCPIVLQKISFSLFAEYLTTRKNKDGVLLSKASYGNCRSSLMFLFKQAGQTMDPAENRRLNKYFAGLKNQIAATKHSSGQRLDEGKKPMCFDAYKLMAQNLLESDNEQDSLFAHTFLYWSGI